VPGRVGWGYQGELGLSILRGVAVQREVHARKFMSTHLRSLSSSRRAERAVEKVLEEGWQQAEAARWAGVAPGTVNRRLKKARAAQAEVEDRSVAARAERSGLGPLEPNESRRVPDIGEFERVYFDGLVCPDCGRHHETPPFHTEMLEASTDPAVKRLMVNVFPYGAKSTTITVKGTCYEVVKDPNSRHGIVSKSERIAGRFVAQIGRFLTDRSIYANSTRNLIDDFGPFHDGSTQWSREGLFVCGRMSPEKDPTVSAYGIGSQILSIRFDRIVCDDIADLKNQANPDVVDDMVKQITQEYNNRVGRSGKVIIVGTRVSAGDVYSQLERLPGYRIIRYPCILDYNSERMLWPDHFGFADAIRMKGTMTAEQFELVYQNSDFMSDGASFTQAQLERCRDQGRVLGQLPRGVPLTLFVGVDPAGAGKQAGYTAMVLLGVDRSTGARYLIDLVNVKQMKQPQMQAQVFDWVDRFAVHTVRYESVSVQEQLFQTAEYRKFCTQHNTKLTGHKTHGGKGAAGKWDPHWGIEAMSTSFHNGDVSLPWGNGEAQRRVGELESQLRQFPMEGGATDLMMAYWFADTGCRLLTERSSLSRFAHRNKNRLELPARARKRRRIINLASGSVRVPTASDFRGGGGDPLDRRRPVLANMELDDDETARLFGEGR